MKPFASDIEVDAVEPLRQRPSADPVPCLSTRTDKPCPESALAAARPAAPAPIMTTCTEELGCITDHHEHGRKMGVFNNTF